MHPWIRRTLTFAQTLFRLPPVRCVASARLPTGFGEFDMHVYTCGLARETHVALVCGKIGDGENVLTRVHSSCLTGDLFHSARCDCGQQLHLAMERIAGEGRGIGLVNKVRAYALQDQGAGLHILRHLGVKTTRLLSNNPKKLAGVTGEGLLGHLLSSV